MDGKNPAKEAKLINGDKIIEINNNKINSIILEDGVNEFDTQCMLTSFFGVEEYEEVRERLDKIGHITNAYNGVITLLSGKLEKVLGKDKLLQYRRDNDTSVIEEFDLIASQSDIAKKYCGDAKPFDILDKKMFASFLLESKKVTMTPMEYGEKSKELMLDGLAPLCAYQDRKYQTMPLETYEEVRNSVLGINVEFKEQNQQEEHKTM